MVTKVHSGVFTDQVLAGSLRAFAIGGLTAEPAAETAGGTAGLIGQAVGEADGALYLLPQGKGNYFPYDEGTAIPNTLAELIYRVISTRSTVVSVKFNAALDEMHVLLENASGWGYHSVDGSNAKDLSESVDDAMQGLVAQLNELVGLEVTTLASDVDAPVVDGSPSVVAGTATVVEHDLVFGQPVGSALGDERTIGGIGGNEHDQDTFSNDIPAPRLKPAETTTPD